MRLIKGYAIVTLLAVVLAASSCISDTTDPGDGGGNPGGSYQAMLDRHNSTRAARGVDDLVPSDRLDSIAQDQADYMAAHQSMAGAGAVRQASYDGMGAR